MLGSGLEARRGGEPHGSRLWFTRTGALGREMASQAERLKIEDT